MMALPKGIIDSENKYLDGCLKEISKQIGELSEGLEVEEVNISEFKKFIWENRGSMDPVEIRSNLMSSDIEVYFFNKKANYLKKLYRIKNSPYFGRIDFTDDKANRVIYIGITHLIKDNKNLIYDWRAPISSLFYDYELGSASYVAPEGVIKGELTKKRQYKIRNGKLIHIFDNDVNVTDEFLQEVLTTNSSDKMKNIVNTIQREQNEVIRSMDTNHLIVQGIAGSGKTSVALHRIAFLLYKLEHLTAGNVLIFSPNNIFSEYISNVLPELGEANALETTFSDFALKYILEFKSIESFASFIERYYTSSSLNKELIKFKMSDEMIKIIDDYVDDLIKNAKFEKDVKIDIVEYSTLELNDLFSDRYAKMTLFERIELMAEHICNVENKKYGRYGKTIINRLWDSLNIERDMKVLYKNIFKSNAFNLSDREINSFVNGKMLLYEDSLLWIYLQGKLRSFPYSSMIKQIVIDEAQDYTKLQYIILKKIFPKASFTILGDINQNINPYYKYNSLNELSSILGECKYLGLTKTYRSSPEIIEFANKILGLKHVVSVRVSDNCPVIEDSPSNIYDRLKEDIVEGQKKYKKIAIITKSNEEAERLYNILSKSFPGINYLSEHSERFNHDLVILPSYLAKGLEFDLVIVYTDKSNKYKDDEKYLYYVVVTRAQHELRVYNQV